MTELGEGAKKKKNPVQKNEVLKSGQLDSNQRPFDPQSNALNQTAPCPGKYGAMRLKPNLKSGQLDSNQRPFDPQSNALNQTAPCPD